MLQGSSINSFDDLKGKRIAVTAGSISLRRMRACLASLPGATLIVTPLSSGNLEAVAKGKADAASNSISASISAISFRAAGRKHYAWLLRPYGRAERGKHGYGRRGTPGVHPARTRRYNRNIIPPILPQRSSV